MFREYGGTELLCELFEKYRDTSIAKAFGHVLNYRDNNQHSLYNFNKLFLRYNQLDINRKGFKYRLEYFH